RDDLQRGRGRHAVADADHGLEALLDVLPERVAHPASRVAHVRLQLAAGTELHVAADVDAVGAHDAAGLPHHEPRPDAGEARHGAAVPPAPHAAPGGAEPPGDGRAEAASHPPMVGQRRSPVRDGRPAGARGAGTYRLVRRHATLRGPRGGGAPQRTGHLPPVTATRYGPGSVYE